jgi:hypothetical protein
MFLSLNGGLFALPSNSAQKAIAVKQLDRLSDDLFIEVHAED